MSTSGANFSNSASVSNGMVFNNNDSVRVNADLSPILSRCPDGTVTITVNLNSPSCVDEAERLDDFAALNSRDLHKNIQDRAISSKNYNKNRKALRTKFVCRLGTSDQGKRNKDYQDGESKVRRLKQRALIQMMESNRSGGDSGDDRARFDGNFLEDAISQMVAEIFLDITEQHNVFECMESLEDLEIAHAEEEIRQAKKMLQRLEGHTDNKSLSRKKDFREKIDNLSAQVKFSKLFKRELTYAKEALHHAHGQEIQDGYNLIPKAVDLCASLAGDRTGGDDSTEARKVSIMYQQTLGATTLTAVMDITYEGFGAKNIKVGLHAMLELSGVDIQSANPSRDVQLLIIIRETLFRTEISVQLFDAVGELRKEIVVSFEKCSKKTFTEVEQYNVTKSLAKLSDQAYMSESQLWEEVLNVLGVSKESDDMEGVTINERGR
ncbi:MAG: hypothetical protein LBJ94_01860 [Puniceicoccales bacterium]|jgi:hypothetical protein|nr:hypothetical protein [Puniceicoccales bacterium]